MHQRSDPNRRSPWLAGCALLASSLLAATAQAEATSGDRSAQADTFEAALSFGAGAGRREARVPTPSGPRRLLGGPFPALDLGLSALGSVSDHVMLGARFRYQTSVALLAEEQPDRGAERQTPLRSHHVELGVLPALRFGASSQSVVLGLFAGWAIRGLRAVVDVTLPPYTLHGPVLRAELRVPIAGVLVLRLAPELIAPISVSDELRSASGVNGPGLALGGEASLSIQLGGAWAIDASYRDSRASLPTRSAAPLTDIEQFGTLQAVIQY